MREFAGNYTSDELDAVYTRYLDREKLKVRVKKNPPLLLEMTDKDAFNVSEFKLIFELDKQAKISALLWMRDESRI